MKKSKRFLSFLLVCCLAVMVFPISASAATVTDRESNDSAGAAQVISLGDSISGAISEGGDVDFYEFTLTKSGKVSMTVTAYMEYYSVILYDASGNRVWYDDSNKWNATVGFRSDDYDLYLEAGTYYLEMRGSYYYSGDSKYPGTYSISTSFTPANATESEPNNSVADANAVALGNTILGVIAQNGDYDFYKFTLTESGKVSMTVTAYMEYYSVILYDASGNRVWYDDYNNWNATVGFRNDDYDLYLEEGTYYLEMRGSYYYSGDSKYPGTYSISTSFTSANATESEPNNSAGNANSVILGSTIRGVIAQNGDYDFYEFTLTKSGEVSMKVTAYMEYYSVILYDASGSRVWYDDYNNWNASAGYREDEYSVTLDEGTYYLEIRGSYYYSGDSKYPGTYVIALGGGSSAVAVTGVSLNQSAISLEPGDTVTLTATVKPSDAENKSVEWSSSNTSVATVSSSGVVTAKAEGKATITAKTSDGGYTATCTVTVTDSATGEVPFKDVPSSAWYYDAVQWAVGEKITSGTGSTTFSPNDSCTRAQAVTFLWRAAGKPEPTSAYNPFGDVDSGDYYYKAVLWAVENGITSGTSSSTFSPDSACLRSQIVTFLYRYAGAPTVSGSTSFSDVPSNAYYYSPVRWAVNNGITSGTGNGKFSPDDTCTRAQIVTFLYRYLAE